MPLDDAAAVRLLALWLQRRRELTTRVEGLLLHGPTAVERVVQRADELRAGYRAEQEALEALLVHARGRAQPEGAPEPAAIYPPLRSVPPVAPSRS